MRMTLDEAIERLRENLVELPVNAVEFNRGYVTAIRDLKDIADEGRADNESYGR